MKDNFSGNSDQYAKYRPTYPDELFEFVFSQVRHFDRAWDAGTGNGQVAGVLARNFQSVEATDISADQISNAIRRPNVHYSLQSAEAVGFNDDSFDLITVAQAIHWFDFGRFYSEVKRTAKTDACLAIIGYGNNHVNAGIDAILHRLYKEKLDRYWDKERRYIDENYRTIPFPFKEIEVPDFENTFHWSLEHFIGYLNTWSGLKHFIKAEGYNPLEELLPEIREVWGTGEREVKFPILFRMGWINY